MKAVIKTELDQTFIFITNEEEDVIIAECEMDMLDDNQIESLKYLFEDLFPNENL